MLDCIGGEYAAVNSAIDELIPAKYRGRIDLIVNGSFWLGAAAGALASPFLLDQNLFPANIGWRLGFGIGGTLGLSILMLRRFVPESPRWLVTHCRSEEAEATVEQIEAQVAITNLAGHRFPSGVGFRRAFIELLVLEDRDGRETVVWGSGRTNGLGVIVDGDGKVLPTEFFTEYTDGEGRRQQHFQPHYQVITSQDQVQIYEELIKNAAGEFTTSFIRRDETIKDNRLLPIGWTEHGPDPSLNGKFLESTHAFGVNGDPDYVNGNGTDQVTYRIQLPAGVDLSRTTVRATLYYQATPPSYLADRFKAAPKGAATQRLYYLASHLDLNGTPAQDWKLKVGSARVRPQIVQ